jgi:uncharacterized protein YecT (DUF1311 family)
MKLHRSTLGMIASMTLASTSILSAETPRNLDQPSCVQFHKADISLNETYSKILKLYAKDKQFITKLKTAQRAWLAFRDAQLEALFPKTDKRAEYGSVYPMCHCSALQVLTEARTTQLQRWLDGTQEGDVCAGSVKVVQRIQSKINDQTTIAELPSN